MATSPASEVNESQHAVSTNEVEESTSSFARPVVSSVITEEEVPIDEYLPEHRHYTRSATLDIEEIEFEEDETPSTTAMASPSAKENAEPIQAGYIKVNQELVGRGVHFKPNRFRRSLTLDLEEADKGIPSGSGSEFGDEHNHEIFNIGTDGNGIIPKFDAVSKSMKPEIYRAASRRDLQFFKQLASDDPEFSISDQVSPRGRTVLHIAAAAADSGQSAELVNLILRRCPDLLTAEDNAGDTALHVAAREGHVDAMKELIRFAKEHQQDKYFWFAYYKQKNRKKGNPALLVALENLKDGVGRGDVVRLLLEERPCPLEFCENEAGETALYLATVAGNLEILKLLLEKPPMDRYEKSKQVAHAAIKSKNTEILDAILTKMPTLIESFDKEGRTPLSSAAQAGDLNAVLYILKKFADCAYKSDNNADGFFPIHAAASGGHREVIGEFLRRCPDTWELLTHKGQRNILHVAARKGKARMVKYLLEMSVEIGRPKLVNERDENGDTPLHLATKHWHPMVVSILTWEKSVRLDLVNNNGFTALDVARKHLREVPPFRQRLTMAALKSGGVPQSDRLHTRSPETDTLQAQNKQSTSCEPYKERVNTLLLVATLVATVTFACGFTIPGGNNDESGTATLLSKGMFQAFLICNTIATYSSIMAVVILIAAQLEDVSLILTTLRVGLPLIGLALATMSFAFTAGVYLVVRDLRWLAIMVLVVGSVFACILVVLYLQLCARLSSRNRVLRYLFYHSFCLMVWASGSDKDAAKD